MLPGGWGEGGTKEEEEKIPHMCESIGHRSLRGCCPKTVIYRVMQLVDEGRSDAVTQKESRVI